jgi:hypothetical protein
MWQKEVTRRLLYPIFPLIAWAYDLKTTFPGVKIMIRVKDDNPDVPVIVDLGDGVDAEGSVVPASDGSYKATPYASDNESSVSLLDDGNGGQTAHFGSPNADGSPSTANLTAQVIETETGNVVGNLPTVSVEVSHGAAVSFPNATTKLGDLTDS